MFGYDQAVSRSDNLVDAAVGEREDNDGKVASQ
jgi:hypothetical protein